MVKSIKEAIEKLCHAFSETAERDRLIGKFQEDLSSAVENHNARVCAPNKLIRNYGDQAVVQFLVRSSAETIKIRKPAGQDHINFLDDCILFANREVQNIQRSGSANARYSQLQGLQKFNAALVSDWIKAVEESDDPAKYARLAIVSSENSRMREHASRILETEAIEAGRKQAVAQKSQSFPAENFVLGEPN